MTARILRRLLGVLLVLVVAACGAGDSLPGEGLGQGRQPLRIPGLTGVPCCRASVTTSCAQPTANDVRSVWDASPVDLLVADALVECQASTTNPGAIHHTEIAHDAYLQRISQKILQALPNGAPPVSCGTPCIDSRTPEQRWADFRALPLFQCDPTTLAPGRVVKLDLKHGVKEHIQALVGTPDFANPQNARRAAANGDLRTAGVNLCIAQRLRRASPGSTSGETLFLSEADQRYLLEVIRERSQIAMLQYALLGVAFTTPTDLTIQLDASGNVINLPNPNQRIPELQNWGLRCALNLARGCEESGHLAAMGRDFASAVQLHVMVSEELARLLSRTGSAGRDRGGSPQNPAEEQWGPQSWNHRLFAMAYGGDPLASELIGAWKHPLNTLAPGHTAASNQLTFQWTASDQLPFFRTPLLEPQVEDLLRLARRFDQVKLAVKLDAQCRSFDLEASTKELYERVEAGIRRDDCYVQPTPTTCETNLAALRPTQPFPQETYLLWEKYRITPQHARTLASHLWEAFDYTAADRFTAGCPLDSLRPQLDRRIGPMNIDGTLAWAADATSPTGFTLRATPETKLVPRPLADYYPKFTRFAVQRFPGPGEVVPRIDAGQQGFHTRPGGPCLSGCQSPVSEAKRVMGSISALVATRDMLLSSHTFMTATGMALPALYPQAARANDYFLQHRRILELIAGAVGDESFSLEPNVQADLALTNLSVPQFVSGVPPATFSSWSIIGTYSKDDPFWQPAPGVSFLVCSLHGVGRAGNLIMTPNSSLLGTTLQGHFDSAFNGGQCAPISAFPPAWDDFHGGNPRRWGATLPINRLAAQPFRDILAARVQGQNFQLRLVAAQMRVLDNDPREGQFFAQDGTLGTWIKQQSEMLARNPTKPAYDGFGLRTDWVPPYTAELIGGEQGESSVNHYLRLAKESAKDATAAAELAIDNLLKEEASEAEQVAAVARAQAGIKEERDSLCGPGSGPCGVPLVSMTPRAEWYPGAPLQPGFACPQDPQNTQQMKQALRCLTFDVFRILIGQEIRIAQPVLDRINDPAVPPFEEFAGGKLQTALIEQWRALKAPGERFRTLEAARNAADAQMDVAEAVLRSVQNQSDRNCGDLDIWKGIVSGISVSWPPSFSFGPMLAQIEECKQLEDQLDVEKKRVLATRREAYANLVSAIAGAIDAQAAIAQSAASIQLISNEARLGAARHQLEADLAQQVSLTSFGLFRKFRAYDLWRAKALLENSRRYALTARRAIEARYVVDLADLAQPETFVQSPASWANDVYAYDLSLPSSVGLAIGQGEPGGIYTNQVEDYVRNLEGFVTGYAATRPSAVARDEIDVVTIPGLETEGQISVDMETGGPCTPATIGCGRIYPDRGKWSVRCAGSDTWFTIDPAVPASQACGKTCEGCVDFCGSECLPDCMDACTHYTPIERLRIEFVLDPWGRINSHINSTPLERRFNARWGPLAVNIVGTGIKDCERARDPLGCYGEGFIRYNMRHVGPAWTTDFGETWRALGLPLGNIEAGKALAAELWLDPLKDGWSTSYIAAVARSELELRPLGGAYEIELEIGPEVMIERIERVQLLVGSTAWVKQN